jgi:CheY-like chemotaxis protein
VLIVDDEADIRLLVRVILESAAGDIDVVAEAADGPAALHEFERLDPPRVPDVIVLDNQMPGRSGLEIAAGMLEQHPEQRIILFSAYLDDSIRAEASALGLYACLDKTRSEQLPALVLAAIAAQADPGHSSLP